jgi:NADH-quinone oxidoreductase subunit J
MIIDDLLIELFSLLALAGGVAMLMLRHPMRVALALIGSMLSLAAVYGLLGVHVIAVFQVLIYVGAVMVFMVFAIMLLDIRDVSFSQRFSRWLWPGIGVCAALAALLVLAEWPSPAPPATSGAAPFGVQAFSAAFLESYWLYFELASVLLVVAVLAAVAVIRLRGGGRG